MKYIFVATVKQLNEYFPYYNEVREVLSRKNYLLLDDWLSKVNLIDYTLSDIDRRKEFFYDEYLQNLKTADLVICDISVNSRTVQYQISMALFAGKRTICMRKTDGAAIPFLLTCIKDPNLD